MLNSDNDIKITVLMPAYNTEKYIAQAIDSVLQQHFPYFELLIVNDGSTDKTEQIIRSFNDPRIILINQQNGGVAKALNVGLRQARGKYIARFDADDICNPERLQVQYSFMEANPAYILSGSDAEYIDRDGAYIFSFQCSAHTDEEIRKLPSSTCPFLHVAVIFKKNAVLEAGGYNEDAHTFEDHLLWAVLVKKGKVCNLPVSLVNVRINPESVTIDESWRGSRFRLLKYRAIRNGKITKNDAEELLQIIRQQDNSGIKNGSYYSLLAKKYLWNNYHPQKARQNIRYLIRIHPLNVEAYLMWSLSFLPPALVKAIYSRRKNNLNTR
jgi:glycosyltransferase involved in cell wall biosynthesis